MRVVSKSQERESDGEREITPLKLSTRCLSYVTQNSHGDEACLTWILLCATGRGSNWGMYMKRQSSGRTDPRLSTQLCRGAQHKHGQQPLAALRSYGLTWQKALELRGNALWQTEAQAALEMEGRLQKSSNLGRKCRGNERNKTSGKFNKERALKGRTGVRG